MSLLNSSPHSSSNMRRGASETRVVSVNLGHMATTLNTSSVEVARQLKH